MRKGYSTAGWSGSATDFRLQEWVREPEYHLASLAIKSMMKFEKQARKKFNTKEMTIVLIPRHVSLTR